MGNDIFGYKRSPKPDAVFSNDNSILTFGSLSGNGAIGYLVQGWNISYQQTVQEMFEIGSNAIYWVKGRPAGSGALNRIIAEKGESGGRSFFPKEAYDICDGGAMVAITARGGSCEGEQLQTLKITLDGVLVTGIGFSMDVGNMQLREDIGFRFATMEL